MKNKLTILIAGLIVFIPIIAIGYPKISSLVADKTPEEAVGIIAENLEVVMEKNEQIESGQVSLEQVVSELKAENTKLKENITSLEQSVDAKVEQKVKESLPPPPPPPPEVPEYLSVILRQLYNKNDGIVLDKYYNHYENISFFSFVVEASGDEETVIEGFGVRAIGTMSPLGIRKIKILSGSDKVLAETEYAGGEVILNLQKNERNSYIEPRGLRSYIIAADFADNLSAEAGKTIGFSLTKVVADAVVSGLPISSNLLTASTTKAI